jgi:hypothetical protein
MDTLHGVLRSIQTETKAASEPLTVFREFLARLDALQREARPVRPPRLKPRRKPRRARG